MGGSGEMGRNRGVGESSGERGPPTARPLPGIEGGRGKGEPPMRGGVVEGRGISAKGRRAAGRSARTTGGPSSEATSGFAMSDPG
jgi:hypothetical protein